MTGQRLSAGERIRRRPEFERVFNEGARVHSRFMTIFVLSNDGTAARLGVAATRKVGSATERNRAKRLVREVFRRHKVAAGLDIVVVPRRDILDAPFATLEADYHAALERCRRNRSHAREPRRQHARPRASTRV